MGVFKRFVHFVELPQPEATTASERFLSNEDLLPVPPEKREWTKWSYASFWIADSCNLNTFSLAASGIVAGLSWWQSFICIALGYILAAPFLVANGRPGAVFHTKFPVVARASFGIYGSVWIVLNRVVMSCVWWGVQAVLGGQCVVLALRAIAPSYNNIKNTFPESLGIDTKGWIGFFLFICLSAPTIYPPLHKARWFFTVKAVVAPVGCFTFLIWMLVKAKGAGAVIHQKSALHGSDLVWPMVTSIMSAMANMATLITNNPDITSVADKPSSAFLPQLITLPLGFCVTSLVGILIASAGEAVYGVAEWNVLEILGNILDNSPSHAARFGVFFIAICFVYIQLILNLSANSIGAGCDLSGLLPRFINVRRGSYVALIVGLLYQPWRLFSSSSMFETYLSSYSVLLSSVAGVMLCDYYFIRKGHYRVTDLYTSHESGWYTYTKGINFRAYAAYIAGIAPNLPGMANAVTNSTNAGIGATRLYAFSWFVGVTISGGVYYGINRVWPSAGAFPPGKFHEVDESDYELNGISKPEYSSGSPTAEEEDYEKKYADNGRVGVYDVPELRR